LLLASKKIRLHLRQKFLDWVEKKVSLAGPSFWGIFNTIMGFGKKLLKLISKIFPHLLPTLIKTTQHWIGC